MKKYNYLIIGGGMAGSAAVMGIRENDTDGSIAVFSEENFEPYNRPPLTKGLWDGKDIEKIVRPIEKYHVDLFLETTVSGIDPDKKIITTSDNSEFNYDKLLIATGGEPIHLPGSPEGVIYYRTRADYHNLRSLTEQKDNFCVIGGGFIGSEIAAALAKNNKNVTMIFPEPGISGLKFPDDLAEYLNDYYREKGVTVLNSQLVSSIRKYGDRYEVEYHPPDGEKRSALTFDGVIVGIGIKPNIALAKEAGIEVGNGIFVNEYLQTNIKDVYAAGDVASFNIFGLNKDVRVEHEDNANKMGMTAGRNMSGDKKIYDNFPFFYSDLFDLGYEAVGELNQDYEIFSDWIDPYKKGTLFYLKDKKVRGLIFWNLWGNIDKGREVILSGASYEHNALAGLFTED